MKYLLSEAEFRDLSEEANKEPLVDMTEKQLQSLCTKICDAMPVETWHGKDKKPWGCILSKESRIYCDECPVQNICPHPNKEWSK